MSPERTRAEINLRLATSYASREALAFSENSDDSDEVADAILAGYALGSRELSLVANRAALVGFARGQKEAFREELYELALWKARDE